jgi:hypothetical protein
VPKISRDPAKSGILGTKNPSAILIRTPSTMSIRTEGILVFFEMPLNQNDSTTMREAPIIRL